MKNLNVPFLLKALVFVFFSGLIVVALHSEMFNIRETIVQESTESQGKEIFDHLSPRANEIANFYHQQNIWWANVEDIARKVKALPGVKDVIVERLPPATLKIVILPEAIRFVYVTGNSTLVPVTESGTVISSFKSKIYPDAPITREEKIIKNSKIRAQAVDLVSSIPESGLFSQSSVAEIEIDKASLKKPEEKTSFWLSLIQPDVKVKMTSENAALKSERVERVLDYTRKHNLHARVIDSEYSKKVVVKLRKDR